MDADAVAVSGVWSPSCAKSSPPRVTGSPPCANATAVTLVLAQCPHFQLENAPRDMPLFGLLSASVLLTVGLIANGMVISFQLRRRRRRLPRSPATATAAARDPGVLHPTLAPPLPFVTVLALADLLGCGVVFTSHIAYSLAVSSSPAPRATPVIYMVFMGTVTWLGLVETLIIGAMASQRVYSVMYPQRPLPGSGWVKAVFVVVGIGGLMALPPGGGLWCDISQWTLSTMWACPDCQDFFRSLLDCRVFTFFYCILTLTVIISSCLSYAALSIFSRVHTGAAKPEPVVSNGPKPNTGNNPKPVKMFGIVFADTVCTTICWTPFLVQSLINQEHSATAGPVHAACTLDSTFPQIALVPMLLHPLIYILACDEVSAFFHSSWSKKQRQRAGRTNIFESPFDEQEPSSRVHLTRSTQDREADSTLPSGGGGSSGGGRRSSVKRNVCFDIERSNRPRFFFADLWPGSKANKLAKRKPTRYWKRYSYSSEPMSLFSSSSSSSINHMHQIASGPLPDAVYKRERIARRSSAFKSSSNVSNCTPSNSSGRECSHTVVMFLADDTSRRRCSF